MVPSVLHIYVLYVVYTVLWPLTNPCTTAGVKSPQIRSFASSLFEGLQHKQNQKSQATLNQSLLQCATLSRIGKKKILASRLTTHFKLPKTQASQSNPRKKMPILIYFADNILRHVIVYSVIFPSSDKRTPMPIRATAYYYCAGHTTFAR